LQSTWSNAKWSTYQIPIVLIHLQSLLNDHKIGSLHSHTC
jgi:hypothetical protein